MCDGHFIRVSLTIIFTLRPPLSSPLSHIPKSNRQIASEIRVSSPRRMIALSLRASVSRDVFGDVADGLREPSKARKSRDTARTAAAAERHRNAAFKIGV